MECTVVYLFVAMRFYEMSRLRIYYEMWRLMRDDDVSKFG